MAPSRAHTSAKAAADPANLSPLNKMSGKNIPSVADLAPPTNTVPRLTVTTTLRYIYIWCFSFFFNDEF